MDSQHPTAGSRLRPATADLADRLSLPGADLVVLVARLCLGAIFVLSGWGKLAGLAAFSAVLATRGVPAGWPADGLAIVGAAVEFFGGLSLMLGFAVRPMALLMVAFILVATGLSHRFWEFEGAARRAQEINFEKNVGLIGGMLALFLVGAGRFGLDSLWDGRRR